jgi:hypothetical protein
MTTTSYRRRTGRSPPCVNSDSRDYREHRMRTVYMRATMIGRGRNHRSMRTIGYYCFKCEKFWTDDDLLDKVAHNMTSDLQIGVYMCQL